MDTDFDLYFQNMKQLSEWYESNKGTRNEATTRMQLIDRLLFDCLAWSRDDISCEESQDGQYADYTFLYPRSTLILEAKKEGNYFLLPVGTGRHEYSLTSLVKTDKNIKAAANQVAEYCQKRGVPNAAICNGHQLILFVASRNDGNPPLDGKCLVFDTLDSMLSNFTQLWNVMSKPAIAEQNLKTILLGDIRPVIPPKLSANLNPYPGTKGRNPFQLSMKIVSETILEDLPKTKQNEANFLKACYCPSEVSQQYVRQNEQMLEQRHHALFGAEAGNEIQLEHATRNGELNPTMFAQAQSRRPILLIGDVGVGKTTFIRYLINNNPQKFSTIALPIYINFGTAGARPE